MNECFFANYTIGKDAYKNISNVCLPLGRRVLILGGETALSKSIDKLKSEMGDFEIVDCVVYGKECTRKKTQDFYEKYKDKNIDFIMGVGGGKALDTSKGTAELLGVPIVTVPTIASTCAASSAISIMYTDDHVFDGGWNLKKPAYHIFIDTEIIMNSPDEFFIAGIGDTLAKYYEIEFSTRKNEKSFNDETAISLSRMCNTPLINSALCAIKDKKSRKLSSELECVLLIVLVSTGMVSMLVNDKYNGAVAHSLFYGLTAIEGFEEKFRHGDVIGYTTIVQLVLDNQIEDAEKIAELVKNMGVETTLAERGIKTDYDTLEKVINLTLENRYIESAPYTITKNMLYDAIIKTEELFGGNK